MKMYIARHGITQWNEQGRMQGWSDSPLTAQGQQQAVALGALLRETPLDAAYISPAGRAQHTADLAFAGRALLRRTDDRLREHGLGLLEGMTREEALVAYGEEGQNYFTPPQETMEHFSARIQSFLDELVAGGEENVLLLTHGATMRQIIAMLFDDGSVEAFYRAPHVGNAEVFALSYRGDGWIKDAFPAT